MSLALPMRCSTGCGAFCYPGKGQCIAHVEDTASGHPWLPCAGCRRALDRIRGPLADLEDELCDACGAKEQARSEDLAFLAWVREAPLRELAGQRPFAVGWQSVAIERELGRRAQA